MSVAIGTSEEHWIRRLGETRSVAIYGIALGILAFWLSLPPWDVRFEGGPIALGIAGALCGLWAVTRDEQKLGWWAISIAIAGTGAALWAQTKSTDSLDAVVNAGLFAATLRFATPLAFAAMGGIFSERSGVVNIALEGMMLSGAFFGIWAAAWSGSWVVGILMAMVFGGLLALIHAFFSIHLRADQIVSGTAINFLAIGLTGYLFRYIYGTEGTPSDVSRVPEVTVPGLDKIPFVGDVIGTMNLMIWLMLALLVATWIVLFKTPIGLRIRSVGEHPRAADTVGISVYGIRYGCVVLSGMLAALGGAYLSIGFVGSFNENMTVGRGFIALAAVIFGKWRPFPAFAACLLFGFSSGLAQRLQSEADISANLLQTLPYVLTLIALIGVVGRSRGPAAAGRPYVKQ
ncbi:MAG TPA: ABC transporter permease [Gaiellaceae bacterium]|nr:ABC transporter permease [Gaiellaceae bacterium]